MKEKKLIIVGDSSFAHIAYEYFTHDSHYEVVAFSVERAYLQQNTLFNLPVLPFEELTEHCPPGEYSIYVAIVYTQLNRLRTRLYYQAKQWGYAMASYISPRAFVWSNVKLGEHNFIFENNVIQPFVELGSNNVLWSGNHIGHHSVIKNNCFISSHVVISGHCTVGNNCFLGVNSTLIHDLRIADDCVIGAGSLIVRHLNEGMVYKGNVSRAADRNSFQVFHVPVETSHEVA